MFNKKAFTLMELLVVLIIIAILACIIINYYNNTVQQNAATAAEHNLIDIYNAQKSYYFSNNGTYCTTSTPTGSACGAYSNCSGTQGSNNNVAAINCNLSLNITDNYYYYSCQHTFNDNCTAVNQSNANIKLILVLSNPLVLPGGTNCPVGTINNSNCNPTCDNFISPTTCPAS